MERSTDEHDEFGPERTAWLDGDAVETAAKLGWRLLGPAGCCAFSGEQLWRVQLPAADEAACAADHGYLEREQDSAPGLLAVVCNS